MKGSIVTTKDVEKRGKSHYLILVFCYVNKNDTLFLHLQRINSVAQGKNIGLILQCNFAATK